jgi:urease accessory protein UreF
MSKLAEFEKDMAAVLNKHGIDVQANTQNYILAAYVTTCIAALKSANVAQTAYKKVNQNETV